jgi:hypothetical protein
MLESIRNSNLIKHLQESWLFIQLINAASEKVAKHFYWFVTLLVNSNNAICQKFIADHPYAALPLPCLSC